MTCRVSRHLHRRFHRLLALLVLSASACDSPEHTIQIIAEDFRFTPAELHVSADRPIRLTIVNEGREAHEFKSRLLAHQVGANPGRTGSLPIGPNHKAETVIRTTPGVYLFHCAIRGHAGMSGTIIVE
jgi:plastocyanin